MALVVEAHPVNHRGIVFQPEQPRPRIAVLRSGRHRADLGKPEAHRQHLIGHLCVLVEPGSDADRVGQGESKHFGCQLGCIWWHFEGV